MSAKRHILIQQSSREERWLWVPGFEGKYSVSDFGRICSFFDKHCKRRSTPQKFLTFYITRTRPRGRGYYFVKLSNGRIKGGRTKHVCASVHVLVLQAFVGPRPPGQQGCHNDGNPKNNLLTNLRWDTPSGNYSDRKKHRKQRKTFLQRLVTKYVPDDKQEKALDAIKRL